MKRSYKNEEKRQFYYRKWIKWRFSFKKHHPYSSDTKRFDIVKINVGFKLMILKFQSKSKNQKYPQLIKKTKIMILATGKNNRVTAKAMSVINKGLNIMFQASKKSTKFEQMTHNHYVTLSAKNMQIEGIAKVRDHPMRDKEFLNLYKIYHHGSFLAYSQLEEEAVIEVKSFLITLYKYDNKIPFRYILEINEKLAYKIEVENTIRKIIK